MCANEQFFLIMKEISYFLITYKVIILKRSPTPPSPLGLLEQFPVIKNIFTENSFFKNKTQFQENEIPAPLLHDKYPFQ